jgi:hypothetical protein
MDLKNDFGALGHGGESEHKKHIGVKKNIPVTILRDHKPVAFGGIEPFYLPAHTHSTTLF